MSVAGRLPIGREGSFAGMAGGRSWAMVLISHHGVERCEVFNALDRRWPDVAAKDLQHEEPTWAMTANEAAALGRRRRGVEPLRNRRHAPEGSAHGCRTCSPDRADAGSHLIDLSLVITLPIDAVIPGAIA
jgi:hypothetical protein